MKLLSALLLGATIGLMTTMYSDASEVDDKSIAFQKEICKIQAGQAYDTMKFRQYGGEKEEIQAVVSSPEGLTIIDMAYARPLTTNKKHAMQAFKEHVSKLCTSQIKG